MTTEQIKTFMEAPIKVGDYVTLKADSSAEDDDRTLHWDPVAIVKEVLPDGRYRVGNKNWLNDREYIYNENEITKFLLLVRTDESEYFATFDDFDRRLDLIAVRDLYSGDTNIYHEDYLYDGVLSIIKDPLEVLEYNRRMDQHYESAENIASMREVSKQGVMEHLNKLNPNVKGKIMSFISGYNVGTPNEKAHMKILQEYMTRPRGTPGAGVNIRYGKELPLPPPQSEFNKALDVPLPHGPTEANFMGGKRSGPKRENSRGKIGTQMARRGTRRSRGIFSRLYAPIGHLLSAGKESVGAVTNTAKGVVGEGIHGLDKIGRSVTKHANMAVKDVFTRKGGKRKARGTRKSRKSKRSTRRR
jgi:hypothetical protein